MSTRREFLTYASLTALLTSLGKGALAADSGDQARAFSFDELIEQAQADALKPYRYPNTNADALLAKLDYAAHGQIRFKPELALFAKGPGQFPVTFFHLGSFFRTPVRVYAVDKGVATWVPSAPAEASNRYRLHWLAQEPYAAPLAKCVATRLGKGGQPGQPRPVGVRKFVVEFQGTPLEKLAPGVKPEAVISCSRGELGLVFTEAVPDGVAGHWRAQFDLTVDGKDPVELRLFLRLDGQPLSETWLYQYHPFHSDSTAIGVASTADNSDRP